MLDGRPNSSVHEGELCRHGGRRLTIGSGFGGAPRTKSRFILLLRRPFQRSEYRARCSGLDVARNCAHRGTRTPAKARPSLPRSAQDSCESAQQAVGTVKASLARRNAHPGETNRKNLYVSTGDFCFVSEHSAQCAAAEGDAAFGQRRFLENLRSKIVELLAIYAKTCAKYYCGENAYIRR